MEIKTRIIPLKLIAPFCKKKKKIYILWFLSAHMFKNLKARKGDIRQVL